MTTRSLTAAILTSVIIALNPTLLSADEKPVQHLMLPNVTSSLEAKNVFIQATDELKSKTKLDAGELHEVHMITYSLEKAVAYFVHNSEGDEQAQASRMAEVVELVHLSSENNRTEETRINLEEYFKLADAFAL